jgi:hypothetical protein
MSSPAYKYYSSIYRLCYSFHSSFEEIVDFVDTIKPKRLYSIALPDSTTDKIVNDYFYSSTGKFQGFHFQQKQTSVKIDQNKKFDPKAVDLGQMKQLVLRKRKSFNKEIYSIGPSDDKENSSSGDETSDLNFGSSDDEKTSPLFRSKKLVKK